MQKPEPIIIAPSYTDDEIYGLTGQKGDRRQAVEKGTRLRNRTPPKTGTYGA
ncbi:hypothetical protein RCU45_15750 [Escherichia coli]|nr:hypothetical protein [Escherichia coli]MED0090059.1 hypothetical protein [Escherichia coli]MED9016720.1 hypothetical protein [Escherichia coli]HAY0339771.1 hypothetical protein [Escherichia coli]